MHSLISPIGAGFDLSNGSNPLVILASESLDSYSDSGYWDFAVAPPKVLLKRWIFPFSATKDMTKVIGYQPNFDMTIVL